MPISHKTTAYDSLEYKALAKSIRKKFLGRLTKSDGKHVHSGVGQMSATNSPVSLGKYSTFNGKHLKDRVLWAKHEYSLDKNIQFFGIVENPIPQ